MPTSACDEGSVHSGFLLLHLGFLHEKNTQGKPSTDVSQFTSSPGVQVLFHPQRMQPSSRTRCYGSSAALHELLLIYPICGATWSNCQVKKITNPVEEVYTVTKDQWQGINRSGQRCHIVAECRPGQPSGVGKRACICWHHETRFRDV